MEHSVKITLHSPESCSTVLSLSPLRGHPFMTSTRRGERDQAQVDACVQGEGIKTHVDVHTEN